MAELTREQIDCCRGLAKLSGRVDDAEIVALCDMAARYLELRAEVAALRAEREKIIRDYQIEGDLSLDDIVNRMVVNHLRHLKNHEAKVAALRAALRGLSFTRPDGSICFDGARCTVRRREPLLHNALLDVTHSLQCEEARRALDAETA